MTSAELLFLRYRGKRLLLDANLLLLYLVGSFQRERVTTFKRTADFSLHDFDLLVAIIRQFSVLVTTPHILTEVSNLSNSLPLHLKASWFDFFANYVEDFVEVLTPATLLVRETSFNPFGIADAAVQNAAAETLVLTEDFRLGQFLQSQGVNTINFRDLALTV